MHVKDLREQHRMLLYFTSQGTFNIEIGGVDDACKKKTCIVFGLLTNIHLSITVYSRLYYGVITAEQFSLTCSPRNLSGFVHTNKCKEKRLYCWVRRPTTAAYLMCSMTICVERRLQVFPQLHR